VWIECVCADAQYCITIILNMYLTYVQLDVQLDVLLDLRAD